MGSRPFRRAGEVRAVWRLFVSLHPLWSSQAIQPVQRVQALVHRPFGQREQLTGHDESLLLPCNGIELRPVRRVRARCRTRGLSLQSSEGLFAPGLELPCEPWRSRPVLLLQGAQHRSAFEETGDVDPRHTPGDTKLIREHQIEQAVEIEEGLAGGRELLCDLALYFECRRPASRSDRDGRLLEPPPRLDHERGRDHERIGERPGRGVGFALPTD